MSIETQQPAVETPVAKTVPGTEQFDATKSEETPAVAEATVASASKSEDAAPAPATENPTTEDNTVVAAIPATEGTLGYKEHGFLKSLRYSKHFFWLGEEPTTTDSLAQFIKAEKNDAAHHAVAWAQETGNGVLYYTKRAEDKSTPSGVIALSDASTILKEGTTEFSFTVGKIHHRFQASTSVERDSWIVGLEKKIEEAKALKDDIVARDSYKKSIEAFAFPVPALVTARSSSKGPKKSLDAATATAAATEAPVNAETASTSSSDADKKAKKEAEKSAKKERSQSRKRASIFGILGKKDEDKELKKEEKEAKKIEKEHIKEEKKVEKEHLKEEKKIEAEQKKEEAKATHDSSKAVEAAEAAAIAAVPAAAIAAVEKKDDKTTDEVVTPTEKKNKRTSVFGGFFGKKSVTSPTSEKTEKEAVAPVVPVKETDIPPVSETAPKLDEPIENKPIDTAAVTAPAETIEAPVVAAAPAAESVKETTTAPETEAAPAPKAEKKGGFLASLIKKADIKKEEKKEEAKEEKAAEQAAKDPVAAAAVVPTTDGSADVSTESPAVTEPAEVKEDRPVPDKRRTSFFSNFGTKKKTTDNVETEGTVAEVKREKSPLPSKIGGLFRKPSKAVKPTEPATTESETVATDSAVPATITTDVPESKIVGDIVPEEFTAPVHNAVTIAPAEAKTSA